MMPVTNSEYLQFFGRLNTLTLSPTPPQEFTALPSEVPTAPQRMGSFSLEKFADLPPINGLLKNFVVVFLNDKRNEGESSGFFPPDRVSRDKFLNEFGANVCQYLLDNDVGSVRLASNMKKAKLEEMVEGWELRYKRPEHKDFQAYDAPNTDATKVQVTVALLERSFVKKNQQDMYSIVEDAVLKSTMGVIVFVDAPLASPDEVGMIQSKKWLEFVNYVKVNNLWDSHLEIVCSKHNVINRVASAEDLKLLAPLGGCNRNCGMLECGHHCAYPCHASDRAHITEMYVCQKPCERKCPRGHECDKLCYEECEECLTVITLRSSCGHHKPKQIFCCDQEREMCQRMVRKAMPCGHTVLMKCSDDPRGFTCGYPLIYMHPCGHTHYRLCSERIEDIRCDLPVVVNLVCGHSVVVKCSEFVNYEENISCPFTCNAVLKCGHPCKRRCHIQDLEHRVLTCLEPCRKRCARNIHICDDNSHKCGGDCGTCNKTYENRLSCGHTLIELCSAVETDENQYVCHQPCLQRHPLCDHVCGKLCYEPCGPCEKSVMKRVPDCPRGHYFLSTCQDNGSPVKCSYRMRIRASCGHVVEIPCCEADGVSETEAAWRCQVKCTKFFDGEKECGHPCRGECSKCCQGRLHARCREYCGKDLICGHLCRIPCSIECPPCGQKCFNFCEHVVCELPCGVPCVWQCQEPCQYKCPHSECTNKCSEVCNKTPCNEQCPKMLSCGHQCVGICGEPCPPHCRTCNPDGLLSGDFFGNSEIDDNDRFIFLEGCKHSFEFEGFEQWVKTKASGEEIRPIECPLCRTRIPWMRRYSAIFDENRKLIDSVRQKIFGDKGEIKAICDEITAKLSSPIPDHIDLNNFRTNLLRETDMLAKTDQFWRNIWLAKFLKWLCDEYLEVTELVLDMWKILHPTLANEYEIGWLEYFDMFVDRYWPLHINEVNGLSLERKRMEDATKFYSRFSLQLPPMTQNLLSTSQGQALVVDLRSVLWVAKPYSMELQRQFMDKLTELDRFTKCTLALTEEEKKEIVNAFGGTAGRWFKCGSGHVYVITECGGASEIGNCPECGSVIGGENHALVPGNFLAPEMDGAQAPLYPTVLERPDYNLLPP